jgi:hypothetical protein
MQAEIVESVQHSITPGECQDLAYPGKTNTETQCFSTTVENRFTAGLPALNFGASSTLTFNPSELLGDIVLTMTLPAPMGTMYDNWALPRGWGSQFISQLGIRIGGSSLYYFTGDQLEIQTFEDCEDSGKKNAYWQLAGAELLDAADFVSAQNRTASVYIKCPWNSISALQKPLALSTDLLTQPIQLIIQTARAQDVFFPLAGAASADLPSGFESAVVRYKQYHFQDSGHQLARRVDMNTHALTYPLRQFQQTTFRTTVNATAGQPVQINLTGFRAGSVKNITLWALQVDDGASPPVPVNVGNGRNYSQILSAQLSVNGLIYYDTQSAESQLWALCDLKTPGYVENTVLSDAGGGVASATPSTIPWVHIPFAQPHEVPANESELVMGLPIANSVVNVTLSLPSTGKYVISASYQYLASLMFSRGSAEYVF